MNATEDDYAIDLPDVIAAGQLVELLRNGAMIDGEPAHAVAWKAVVVGIVGLTKAERQFYDAAVHPLYVEIGRGLADACGFAVGLSFETWRRDGEEELKRRGMSQNESAPERDC